MLSTRLLLQHVVVRVVVQVVYVRRTVLLPRVVGRTHLHPLRTGGSEVARTCKVLHDEITA
jgi:hypothetical protein